MNDGPKFSVITTIQAPTPSVFALVASCNHFKMAMLSVGDRKTPLAAWPQGSEFISLDEQLRMPSKLANLLPIDHYSRKNMGYLEAITRRASLLFDTDDDNAPLDHWRPRDIQTEARQLRHKGWVNVYQLFSSRFIWPRGVPLEYLLECQKAKLDVRAIGLAECPIQQGLVNGAPDVDAVWRFISDEEFKFDEAQSVWLAPGSWCPFNSQSTWWFEKAFPLLYLPSLVSFRVTDIWRSLVAQRCLWELGYGVAFHSAESVQRRNAHNLLQDFEQEIPGYLNNNRIISILERTQLLSSAEMVGDNLHRCYEALISAGIIPSQEMPLVEAWLLDFHAAQNRSDFGTGTYEASID